MTQRQSEPATQCPKCGGRWGSSRSVTTRTLTRDLIEGTAEHETTLAWWTLMCDGQDHHVFQVHVQIDGTYFVYTDGLVSQNP